MRCYFTRDDAGNVVGVHLGGRLATRVTDDATADVAVTDPLVNA
jgi:hypothetical protein